MARFKAGEINNPNGRPKGTGFRQQMFNDLVLPHKTALLDVAIKKALEGNEAMLRLFLERMLPPKPSGEPVNITLPTDMLNPESLLPFGAEILKGIERQELTTGQAKVLLQSMKSFRDNFVVQELCQNLNKFKENFNLVKE